MGKIKEKGVKEGELKRNSEEGAVLFLAEKYGERMTKDRYLLKV